MVNKQTWITEYFSGDNRPNFDKLREILQRRGLYNKEYFYKISGFLKMMEHIGSTGVKITYSEENPKKPWIKFSVRDNVYTAWAFPVIKDVGIEIIPDFFVLKEDTEDMYRGSETVPNLKIPWSLVYVVKNGEKILEKIKEANYYLRPRYVILLSSEELKDKCVFPPNTYIVEFYDINPIKIKEKLSYLF